MARTPKTPQVDREIDENLRRVYQRVLDEKVPDRFEALLDRLRAQEQGPETEE